MAGEKLVPKKFSDFNKVTDPSGCTFAGYKIDQGDIQIDFENMTPLFGITQEITEGDLTHAISSDIAYKKISGGSLKTLKDIDYEINPNNIYPFIRDFGTLGDKTFDVWRKAFNIFVTNGTTYPSAYYGIGYTSVDEATGICRVSFYGYYRTGNTNDYYFIDATKPISIHATSRSEIKEFDITDSFYGVRIRGTIDFSKLPSGTFNGRLFILGDTTVIKPNVDDVIRKILSSLPHSAAYPFIKDFGVLGDKEFDIWRQAFASILISGATSDSTGTIYYGVGMTRIDTSANVYRIAIYQYRKNVNTGTYFFINTSNPINLLGSSATEVKDFEVYHPDIDVRVKASVDFSKLPTGTYSGLLFIFSDESTTDRRGLTEKSNQNVIDINGIKKQLENPTNLATKAQIDTSARNQEGLWMQKKVITVNKPGTTVDNITNFSNIVAAVASITDASEIKPYEVQLFDNISAYQKADYFLHDSGFYALAATKKYVTLRGMGDTKIIYGELPDGLTLAEYEAYEGMHYDGGGELENIKIIVRNIRYAIHYERSNDPINHNTLSEIKNNHIEHKGGYSGSPYTATDAWGSGTGQAQILKFTGNTIIGARQAVRIHTNYEWNYPNRYIFNNNRLIGTHATNPVALRMDDICSYQKRYCELNNNEIRGSVYCNPTLTYRAVKKSFPYTQITGGGNTPFLFVNETGKAIKITSATTGNTSKVHLVQDTAGYGLIGTPIIKDGSIGLSGYMLGDEDVSLTPNQTMTNGKANLLGHRLGDCTTVNKTLILEIDGTQVTLTFDKNYSGGVATSITPTWTNQQVLNEINTKLGSAAVCSLLGTYESYYPELSDVLSTQKNTSATVPVMKGAFVKRSGVAGIRQALANEIPDGMALDDIAVNQFGRILKNCYLDKNSQYAPLFESGSEAFADGDKFKISANGKLIKDNTLADSTIIALSDHLIWIK